MNSDLNPIENLWNELKVWVSARRPKNLEELEAIWKEKWSKIPETVCHSLDKYYRKRLLAIIAHKVLQQVISLCCQYFWAPAFSVFIKKSCLILNYNFYFLYNRLLCLEGHLLPLHDFCIAAFIFEK